MIMPVFWIFFVVVMLFGFVILYGPPYLPTMKKQAETAIDLLDLKPGQTLLELGCGDGRLAVLAAKRGLFVVGYELNPLLATGAWLRTLRYRRQVSIRFGNFWNKDWPQFDGVYVFLIDKYMEKLNNKITQNINSKKIKLASYVFQIPNKNAQEVRHGIYLYVYNS